MKIRSENRPSPKINFTRSLELLIQQEPLDVFTKPVWTKDLAQRIADLMIFNAVGNPGEYLSALFIWCEPLAVSLVGNIYIRPTGKEEYQVVESMLVFPAGSLNCFPVFSTETTTAQGAQSLDVKFVPNAKLALDYGCTEHFNGVLEWSAIPINLPQPR